MSTSQTQFMNEIKAGHDGEPIPEAKRVYFQERFRNEVFEFLVNRFVEQQSFGLTKAKLARRIGKTPDVINRWLGGPANLTSDTISDLLLGICAEEPKISGSSLLGRVAVNYGHLDEFLPQPNKRQGVVGGSPTLPLSNGSSSPFGAIPQLDQDAHR
jgi:hypothetical protein